MFFEDLLTIVIPSKNEENYIGTTLKLLCGQHVGRTKVIIADANSSDHTRRIVNEFSDRLNIQVIDGGLPSVGRNAGAKLATTKYILFLDSDCQIRDANVIRDCVHQMETRDIDLLSVRIMADDIGARILYWMNNIVVFLSRFDRPFAVGTFMMVRKQAFDAIGGFDPEAIHCEDYVLSKQFDRRRFFVMNKVVYADNRRFKKTGYVNYVLYVLKNAWNRNNPDYFKQDVGYWR